MRRRCHPFGMGRRMRWRAMGRIRRPRPALGLGRRMRAMLVGFRLVRWNFRFLRIGGRSLLMLMMGMVVGGGRLLRPWSRCCGRSVLVVGVVWRFSLLRRCRTGGENKAGRQQQRGPGTGATNRAYDGEHGDPLNPKVVRLPDTDQASAIAPHRLRDAAEIRRRAWVSRDRSRPSGRQGGCRRTGM